MRPSKPPPTDAATAGVDSVAAELFLRWPSGARVYNVRGFGAKGDGSTLDTTAVQADRPLTIQGP